MDEILKLHKNFIISGEIEILTGLRIGGDKETLQIGGVENPVIKDPRTGQPIIPGSSLKGRMRTMIEYADGVTAESKGSPHDCVQENCRICVVFGSLKNPHTHLTRLIVRDAFPIESQGIVKTETKTETSINRLTGQAGGKSLRTLERVPAKTRFKFEIIYASYNKNNDLDYLSTVFEALSLIEDAYLGGSGSRGYGKVRFLIQSIRQKEITHYESGEDGDPLFSDENGVRPSVILKTETWLKNAPLSS